MTINQSHNVSIILFLVFMFSSSCKKDDTSSKIPENIQKMMLQGSLLVDIVVQQENTLFYFESDTIVVASHSVSGIQIDREKWQTSLTLDGFSFKIPTIGTDITLKGSNIELNPGGCAPLSAKLAFSGPVQGRIKIRVKGKRTATDIVHLFPKYGYNHQIEIHGLYPDYNNLVYITFTDQQGKERCTDSLYIKTESLPGNIVMAQVTVTKALLPAMEPGLTLVNSPGDNDFDTHRPYMIDADGDIRWILTLKGHPKLYTLTANVGLSRLKNGNFLCADKKVGNVYELDMMGQIVQQFDINQFGYEFHHEVVEKEDGNILVNATSKNSKLLDGSSSINDIIIEIDRQTGAIVREWDLKISLDEKRHVLNPEFRQSNWAHNNSVTPVKDDAIIISMRFQGVAKLSKDNKVEWVLSPHKGWGMNRRYEGLVNFLLDPLDSFGNKMDKDIASGERASDAFDWAWGSHCPVILPDGNLMLFDNGFYRNFTDVGNNGYSRAVIYKIDEANKTVQQVWEYGKERGTECFSNVVSSVQYLPVTGNILSGPGFGTKNLNGMSGGRIIEVDYQTKEVVFEAHISTYSPFAFHRVTRMTLYPENI